MNWEEGLCMDKKKKKELWKSRYSREFVIPEDHTIHTVGWGSICGYIMVKSH